MKVRFKDITENGIHRVISGVEWASEAGITLAEDSTEAQCFLSLAGDNTALLEGNIKVTVKNECGRCGCPLDFTVDTSYKYTFRVGQDSRNSEADFAFTEEDCNTVYLEEPVIDLRDVLQEQVFLSIPEKMLCSEECKGLCQSCGINLNQKVCNCANDLSDSPFAVLKKLKK